MRIITATPSKINNLELKNRIIMLAIHTGYSIDGKVGDRDISFYEERAKGGAAAVTLVASVNEIGGLPDMYSVATDDCMDGEKTLLKKMHEYDCKLIVQLFHRGRNGGVSKGRTLAPSSVPSPIYRTVPETMTTQEILSTIDDFANAAKRCKDSGIDAVEVSCSAGYLLTQFLSPITNLRSDEYGGDDDKRMKMPLDTLRGVRNAVGKDYPIILRISGSQMIPGGYGLDFMQKFCRIADDEGLIDAVNVTGGWHEAPIPQITFHVPPGGFAYLADGIKRVVNVPVIACNRINNLETMEEILNNGIADFVGTARGFLADPGFANKVLQNKPYNICQGCNKCIEAALRGNEVICAYNPEAGKEYLEKKHRYIATAKKILVVGAGPAGLVAAKKAAQRGYKTTICTKESQLGGQLVAASVPPGKQDIMKFIENKEYELKELGVTILKNTEVDGKFAIDFNPYFVVIASGSTPITPDILGIKNKNVYMGIDVLKGETETITKLKKGATVIIGGGSLGLEVSDYIAHKCYGSDKSREFKTLFINNDIPVVDLPPDITIVEMEKKLGKELGGTKWIVMKELKENGIKTMTETTVKEICSGYILAEKNGDDIKIPADNVIIALGSLPTENNIAEVVENEKISYAKIGDATIVADAMLAMQDAYDLFLRVFLA